MTNWIDNPERLRERLAQLPAVIGMDTEFIRERTYWPQLALVQIALDSSDDGILLVDTLAPGMTAALVPLLTDPQVTKVMHSASEDLVAFKHACGVVPAGLFDTQIAASLAGVGGGLSYQKLVLAQTGISVDKGETRSDWLRRPLSASQLTYAAEDVRHLHVLHRQLAEELVTLERSDWLAEDCTRMLAGANNDEPERWPHLPLRSAQYVDRDTQVRVLRLLRWREAYARSSDRPRSWVLDNELAVTIARQNPANVAALRSLLDATPKSPRSLGDALFAALTTPLADETDAPLARGDDRDKKQLRALQDAVATLAAELGLPDGVLASRKWLETLQDGHDWPGALSGWRRKLLEPRLAPILSAPAG